MKPEEYLQHDMIGLAALVAKKHVTAAELLEAAIERMAFANPKVNAVVLDLTEQAREEAKSPVSGPLAGVPFLVKDHNVAVAGTRTLMSCKVFSTNLQQKDSAVVAAMRQAGLVIFGKTNTPEASNDAVTESKMHGPARNPWDLDRTPGGSSGGSAAAVAAGIVPAAHGSDGGGSIRVPAACVGLFGVKPSRGRVSFYPNNEGPGAFVASHALTRSVRDSAMLLDIIGKRQVGDRYVLPDPERPFLEEVGRPPGKLRIAFHTGSFVGGSIDKECADAVQDVARLCESLGHHMEEIEFPEEITRAAAAGSLVGAVNIAAMLDIEAKRRGTPVDPDELEPITRFTYLRGREVSASVFIQELQAGYALGRNMASLFQKYDLILNATIGSLPLRIGELYREPLTPQTYGERLRAFIPNTRAANIAGLPAMSIPLNWTADNIPVGTHFTAPLGGEAVLFRLAGQLERARPWSHRRPAGFC